MADLAAAANARLLFVTPLSNLRDFAPIKSVNREDLRPEGLTAWTRAFEQGCAFAKAGQSEKAVNAFAEAEAIDDRHADLLFRHAQALLALGKDGEAAALFVRARDEDICPLRALSATRETNLQVAKARRVPLLDFESRAAARADHEIPGDDFLADHVHLKIRASKMLALDILDKLSSEKIVTLTSEWGPAAIAAASTHVEAGIDGPRYAHELYTLSKLLDALGQPEQALKRVEEGMALSGGDLEGLCLAGRYHRKLGRIQTASDLLHRALTQHPGAACAEEELGVLLLEQNNPQAALEHLVAASGSAPNSPSILNRLGVAYALVGRFGDAVDRLERAAQLSPNDPPIRTNLALAHERKGNRRDAILHYQEALRLNPAYAEARTGLDRVTAIAQGKVSH
jgi:tetratricopeptide (TPR) repeat protein